MQKRNGGEEDNLSVWSCLSLHGGVTSSTDCICNVQLKYLNEIYGIETKLRT